MAIVENLQNTLYKHSYYIEHTFFSGREELPKVVTNSSMLFSKQSSFINCIYFILNAVQMLLIAVKLILNVFVQELFFKIDGTDRF